MKNFEGRRAARASSSDNVTSDGSGGLWLVGLLASWLLPFSLNLMLRCAVVVAACCETTTISREGENSRKMCWWREEGRKKKETRFYFSLSFFFFFSPARDVYPIYLSLTAAASLLCSKVEGEAEDEAASKCASVYLLPIWSFRSCVCMNSS